MARIKPQALLQLSKKKKGLNRISVTTILIYALIVIVMAFFLYSSYRHWSRRSQFHMKNASLGVEHDNMFGDLEKAVAIPKYAVIKTSKGSITVELYTEGDVDRPGTTEDWTSKGKHYNQLDTSLKHEAFMLGTSKAKQDGSGFHLFITTAPIADLNEKISVFGRVVKGEEVVQEIEEVDSDEHYQPKTPIEITEVTLKQKI
ncbi:unnamed protein product [Fraxinus pennsylvanica]|uniref:PPIase cyclophilin-type domain-containing protein n=1 Tax=Fraxinus pennsylvanica TaxID=56036 RepID=A0AAD1ZZB4_9LAMI|nr:unnamed protein product [Fraxinus pennsylvanica]